MGIDISLVSPPGRSTDHYRPPIALMCLSAFLESRGITTEIVDAKVGASRDSRIESNGDAVELILTKLRASRPSIVGITCYTPEYMDVIELSGRVKQSCPGTRVVVGGVHPTLKPQDFFRENGSVDFAVVGEGELTLYDLVTRLSRGGSLDGVEGLMYRGGDGELRSGPPRPLIEDLDTLPPPAFDKINMRYYTMPNPYAIRGIPVSSFYMCYGRGCPFNCTFCVSKHLRKTSGPGKYVRYRSSENAVDEVELLKRDYLIDGFYIIDDTFSASLQNAMQFCESLIARRLKLLWACTTRVNQVSEELLRKMKEAGCVQVDFGIESGSEECLKRVKKGINLSQIKKAFEICGRIGMRTFANVLVNIPDETEEDLRKTVELLDLLKPSVCSINILTPFVGTDIYDESGLNLRPDEYEILGRPPLEIIQDSRFRFSHTGVDIAEFHALHYRRYNPLGNFASFLLSRQYLLQVLRSRRKLDYLRQVPEWYRELIRQRKAVA